MSIFISEFFICIYMKNHGFLWISPTPKKTGFITAYFFICSFLIQHRKTVHSVSVDTIYSLICSNSETVSEFLNNTSVRNTFATQSTIFVLSIFSPPVYNQNPVFQNYFVPFFPTQFSDFVIHL